jgi:hypothetical protein
MSDLISLGGIVIAGLEGPSFLFQEIPWRDDLDTFKSLKG